MSENKGDIEALLEEYAEKAKEFPESSGELSLISALANRQVELEQEVAAAELKLNMLQQQLREVSERDLPAAMEDVGMDSFRLASGAEVVVKKDVATSIASAFREEAYAWLDENGHGSIIKNKVEMEFSRDDAEGAKAAMQYLELGGFDPTNKKDVHYQTLQAWGRREAEAGRKPPEGLFHSFDVVKTKIKPPK